MYPRAAQTLQAACNFKSQGQKSRSNMPTFTCFIELSKIHDHVKLYQNVTSRFQIIKQFSYPKITKSFSRSKVKVKCHLINIGFTITHIKLKLHQLSISSLSVIAQTDRQTHRQAAPKTMLCCAALLYCHCFCPTTVCLIKAIQSYDFN